MNRSFHKRALSVTTALLTLTTAVTTADAAQRNEITIKSDATSASSGDTFNVSVGYDPDSLGASGFTVDLYYDTDMVSLNLPQSDDYEVANGFAVVTNYEAGENFIRIVGANLSGGNVKEETEIGSFSFTVKEGVFGEIDFWTEVTTLVAADGGDYINVDYRSHGPYNPYSIEGPARQPEVTETVTSPEETQVPEEVVPPETTSETATTQVTTEPELPETYIPEITEPLPEETQPAQTDPDTDIQPETPDHNGEPLFSHTQGDSDYNNEEPLQYSFSVYDYIDSDEEPVDIEVNISSTGNAQGGIGMMTSDGWKIFGGNVAGGNDAVWTAENVDLAYVQGDISVQLYYLKNNSEFNISSISVSPSSDNSAMDETQTPAETDPVVTEPVNTEPEPKVTTIPEEEAPQESETINSEDESSVTDADESNISANSETDSEPQTYDVDNLESKIISENTSNDSSSTDSQIDSYSAQNSDVQPQQVQNAVSNASTQADGNPDTAVNHIGRYIGFAVMALCAGQMIYSITVLVRRKED